MQSPLSAGRVLGSAADSTLVIVHMDEYSLGHAVNNGQSLDAMISNVLHQIEEAKQHHQAIVPAVMLRFTNPDEAVYALLCDRPIPESIKIPGTLHPQVAAALVGYRHCPEQFLQTRSDASPQIEACCKQEGYPTQSFELIGMYLELCVWSTAAGLHGRFPASSIRVLAHACQPFNARKCWSIYEQPCSAGVELVKLGRAVSI